ncbi:PREDICTED: uncharacterized protein LOC109581606 isoform X2 [Amphimedon queenslandica]|uniref:Uncharacterized protein n=1 Tax=Amphimedon queenslandica TaxID=400682 RepID=A0AAN0J3W2_AMPQE|nr:PREDICTED: uncharacterized protein LOC109581606 isoform X2 [Amphimedon queenslandica]|eukprot:XP_019851432.1 PREDICTED: uncharacterized protein LOC109581606 isoform X2 [Amphimedon queenslandica]
MGVLFLTCLASALFLAEASAPGSSCISDYNNCTGSYYCVDNKSAPEINCSGNVSTFTPHPLPPPPPPGDCVLSDGVCMFVNMCMIWVNNQSEYQCTLDSEHNNTHITNVNTTLLPPGECIYQSGQCNWSKCFSWLDLCQMRWRCHSQYYYKRKPHPICPVRPIAPPPIPGVCRYNPRVGHCRFHRPSELTCTLSYDDCTGGYFCDPGIPDSGNCSVKIPQNIAPPPSICTENSIGCMFYNPCKAWNKGCYGAVPQCTLESEYIQYNKSNPSCHLYTPAPPPKEECLYIDYKCQWYNECAMWLSDTGYQCGTIIDKYIYTHSLTPVKNNGSSVALPPGECINQLGTCTWSMCRSWLNWCNEVWMCGSQYDYEAYFNSPPPPCPPPPQNFTPPNEPGVCQFDLASGHCQYYHPLSELTCTLTYDDCTGEYFCDPGIPDSGNCSVKVPQNIAPPPSICRADPFGCVFYNPCKGWNKGCFGAVPQCTLESEYIQYNNTHPHCNTPVPMPPPKEECLYIDFKCQWYNECAMWLSDTGYQCGTTIDKYIYTHSLIDNSINTTNVLLPPGECINQLGNCTWSICHSWLDWCQSYWMCGSQYDHDVYFASSPPPPCPPPPQNYTPPAEPGVCQYNLTSGHCHYHHTEFNCSLTYDKCTGDYSCSSARVSNPVRCSVPIPREIAPPPDICTENSFGCEYYNPCKAWNEGCLRTNPQCTLESEYIEYNKSNLCNSYNSNIPPPKEECLYIDYKCQWYNECAMWLSDTGYQCGTAIDKYIYTHSLSLIDNNGSDILLPPGECINQLGTCTWSVCRSWMDWCKTRWMCGSQYDYDAYFTTPPPPCPLPPPPPPEPGVCQYDLSLGHCHYHPTEFNCSLTYDKCTGDYSCSSARISNPVSCSVPIPREIAPPPNICTETSFGCEYYNPCKAWNKGCFGVNYQCTLESVYVEYNKTHQECVPFNSLPPPKEECLYIDFKCQWYNECAMWLSDTGYQCGTAIDKYIYTHSLTPVENNRSSVALPPGECINQLGTCTWSMCHSFLDWCQGYWLCGSQYDYEAYFTTPPPLNCPPPPHNPPIEPGVCQYNFTTSHCQYSSHNSVDPCDVVLCPVGSTCQVYGSTSYCKYSCQIANGGCSSNQTCSLVPVQCITAPCYPVVKCTDANVTTYKPANDFITNYILMGIAILTSLVTLAMLCAVIAVKQYRLRKKALVEQEMKLICDTDTTDI